MVQEIQAKSEQPNGPDGGDDALQNLDKIRIHPLRFPYAIL
jgi:hypothetical protein